MTHSGRAAVLTRRWFSTYPAPIQTSAAGRTKNGGDSRLCGQDGVDAVRSHICADRRRVCLGMLRRVGRGRSDLRRAWEFGPGGLPLPTGWRGGYSVLQDRRVPSSRQSDSLPHNGGGGRRARLREVCEPVGRVRSRRLAREAAMPRGVGIGLAGADGEVGTRQRREPRERPSQRRSPDGGSQ